MAQNMPWITDSLERSLEKQYQEMLGPNWHPAETTQPATWPTPNHTNNIFIVM